MGRATALLQLIARAGGGQALEYRLVLSLLKQKHTFGHEYS